MNKNTNSQSGFKKYKLLFITRPAEGGMKKHILTLINNLNQSYFEISLAGPHNMNFSKSTHKKLKTFLKLPITDSIRPYRDISTLLNLYDLLKNTEYDLVHLHGLKTTLIGGILNRFPLLFKEKKPVFLSTVHNYMLYGRSNRIKKQILLNLENWLSPHCDHYITVSRALQKELIKKKNIKPEKITTIYNGINIKPYQKTKQQENASKKIIPFPLPLEKRKHIIGTVARLIPEKGLCLLVDAFEIIHNRFPEALLLIIGEGPLRKKLEKKITKKNLENNIMLTGYRQDIPQILKQLDLFVMPSRSEGLSIALIEAMASGLPVVASSVGGIPELLIDNRSGILIPPGNQSKLAEKIIRILSRPERAKKMGEKAKKRAVNKFTIDRMINKTEDIYLELLKDTSDRKSVHKKYEKPPKARS